MQVKWECVKNWCFSTNISLFCFCELSPRLLAEPRRQEERCVCERARMQDHTVCPQRFHQFIRLVQTSISTRLDHSVRSYTLLQCHCYIESPLRSFLEATTSPTRRPPALSCRDERHENSNSKHEQEVECHTLHTPIYILVSYSPSAKGTLPRPKCPNTIP